MGFSVPLCRCCAALCGMRLACLALAGITPPALVQEVMAMDALCAIPVSLWIVSHFETLPVCVQGNQVIGRYAGVQSLIRCCLSTRHIARC